MTKIAAVINQKGGVGKSTTALALGAAAHRAGRKVLFVDLDSQGNLSYALGATETSPGGALEALERPARSQEQVQATADGDLIAASPGLTGADAIFTAVGKEYRLREALAALSLAYDYVIIDTPPSLGVLTVNALTAAGGIIVPAQADIFSLQGITQLAGTVDVVRRYCNPALKILGILLTRHMPRSILSRDLTEVIDRTAQDLGTRRFKTAIRETVVLREAAALRRNIFEYAPKSNGAQDYQALAKEVMKLEF